MKLTKRMIEAADPADADRFSWDSEVKGFGLKITPAGRKVFLFQYRMGGRGSKTQRCTIGQYGSPFSVDGARTEAVRLLAEVRAGRDPAAAKRASRNASPVHLFGEVAAEFVERYAKVKTRDWRKTERLLAHDVLPFWVTRPVGEITRRDAIELIDRVVDRGAPVHANRVLASVRVLFNWAVARGIVEVSPVAGVKAPGVETSRSRVLSEDELRAIWAAANETEYPYGPYFKMLLLTAARRSEVAAMQWHEIEETGAVWTIPAERSKNRRAHEVPLTPKAIDVLRSVPRVEGSDFVFTTSGRVPIGGFSKAKTLLDRASSVGLTDRDGWVIHDIRRSVATAMAEMGTAPHVIDRALNHIVGSISQIALIYNRATYLDERRNALEGWARRLIDGDRRGNVVAVGR